MGQTVANILAGFDEVFEEESWQIPVRAAISGLTASQAAWKPSQGRHSIWEIANHLSFWKQYISARMAGEPRRPRGWAHEADWQEIPEVTEEAWRASVQRLVDAQAALKSEFSKRTDDDLQHPLPGDKLPLSTLQSMTAHDAYHCGQICYIRALQGIPAKGSWDK